MPKNLETSIFSAEDGSSIASLAFWDETGRAYYRPVMAINTSFRMYIYPYEMTVDPVNRQGSFTRVGQNKSILDPSTVFTHFKVTDKFLVATCQTCNNGLGWVRVYNPDSAIMLFL